MEHKFFPNQDTGSSYRGASYPPPEQYENNSSGPSTGKPGKGVLIALIVILVGIGVLGGYFLLNSGENGNGEIAVDQDFPTPEAIEAHQDPATPEG